MIQHPDIDTAIHCLDEMFESMAGLYDQASRQSIDQSFVESFWKQARSWNERYMEAFGQLRRSTTQKEWDDATHKVKPFASEGFNLEKDFRTWYDGALDELLAELDRREAEFIRKEQEFRKNQPIGWFVSHYIMFPIFDGIDWFLLKTTGKSWHERLVGRQD